MIQDVLFTDGVSNHVHRLCCNCYGYYDQRTIHFCNKTIDVKTKFPHVDLKHNYAVQTFPTTDTAIHSNVRCPFYSDEDLCSSDSKCIWTSVTSGHFKNRVTRSVCQTIDKDCVRMDKDACDEYEKLSNECIWMGTECRPIFNCSKYDNDNNSCTYIQECIYDFHIGTCIVFYNDCSLKSDKRTCYSDYRCITEMVIASKKCYLIDDKCIDMGMDACTAYRALAYSCYWDSMKKLCLPIFSNCSNNHREGCIKAKECVWNGTKCNMIAGSPPIH